MSKHGHTPDGTPFGGDPKATPVGVSPLPHDYHDVWQGGLDGTDQAAIEEAKRRRTPAPGVEEVVEQIDGANVESGDIHAGLHNAINHVFFAKDGDEFGAARDEVFAAVREILRTLLTTHQQEKEALVREILQQAYHYPEGDGDGGAQKGTQVVEASDIKAIAKRHGITSDNLKS